MEAEVKRRKRRVVLVALAACLVVAGIGGTLAWFSAQSSLTNTFKAVSYTHLLVRGWMGEPAQRVRRIVWWN